MQTTTLPIRGFQFRPHGRAIVRGLTHGQSLVLEREPDNEYDPHAVKIILETGSLSDDAKANLADTLPGGGIELDEFLTVTRWHIGYIPKEMSQNIGTILQHPEQVALRATFTLDVKGYPSIELSAQQKETIA